MPYIRNHARFTILDDVPADVWQEPEATPGAGLLGTTSDPVQYLCIVGEDAFDYRGDFCACEFTAALYQCVHVGVSAEYLRDACTLAPEATARKIIAFYLCNWASLEDDETAELLRDDADRIARG